jgi:hypothetical protein
MLELANYVLGGRIPLDTSAIIAGFTLTTAKLDVDHMKRLVQRPTVFISLLQAGYTREYVSEFANRAVNAMTTADIPALLPAEWGVFHGIASRI